MHNACNNYYAENMPVTLSSCALMVSCFWQSGTDHSLTRPLQAAVARARPSGANWQAALGLSSASSLLWFITCTHSRTQSAPLTSLFIAYRFSPVHSSVTSALPAACHKSSPAHCSGLSPAHSLAQSAPVTSPSPVPCSTLRGRVLFISVSTLDCLQPATLVSQLIALVYCLHLAWPGQHT